MLTIRRFAVVRFVQLKCHFSVIESYFSDVIIFIKFSTHAAQDQTVVPNVLVRWCYHTVLARLQES